MKESKEDGQPNADVDSGTQSLHELVHGFGALAELYDWARPSYPAALIGLLEDQLDLQGSGVVDIGAGTGKFTEILAGRCSWLAAVEPLEGMRTVLSRKLPHVVTFDSPAEQLPLEDQSVDVITAVEAFHWFDPIPTWSEITRVLRPGGVVLVAWLHRQNGANWQRQIYQLLERVQGDVPSPLELDPVWKSGWSETAFSPLAVTRFHYELPYSIERLRAMFATYSYVAALPETERNALLDEICVIAASSGNSAVLRIEVEAWTCRKL